MTTIYSFTGSCSKKFIQLSFSEMVDNMLNNLVFIEKLSALNVIFYCSTFVTLGKRTKEKEKQRQPLSFVFSPGSV